MSYIFDTLPSHPPPERLESLTSYLLRLAEANAIRSINDLLIMFFPKHHVSNRKLFTDYCPPSLKYLSQATVCTEEQLVGTTLYYFSKKFGLDNAAQALGVFLSASLSPNLRYCPQCLATQSYRYYSLLWRFNILSGCIVHGNRLAEVCGHCHNPIPLAKLRPPIDVCSLCHENLSKSPLKPMTSREWLRAYGYHTDLEFLLGAEAPPLDLLLGTKRQPRSYLALHRRRSIGWGLRRVRQEVELPIRQPFLTDFRCTFTLFCTYAEVLDISLRDLWKQITNEPTPDLPTRIPNIEDHWDLLRSVEKQQMSQTGRQVVETQARTQSELEIVQQVRSASALLQSKGQPITLNSIAVIVQLSPRCLRQYAAVNAILADVMS